MKFVHAGLSAVVAVVAVVAAVSAMPVFAHDAAQVARAVSPLSLAQYQDDQGERRAYDQGERRGDDRGDRRGDDRGDRRGSDSVNCGSSGYKLTRCRVPWRDATLVRQTSDSACVRDRTWGMDRGGIWVDKGCGGTFVEARRGDGPGPGNDGDWRPGPGWDTAIRVRCASHGYHYNMCQVDTGRGSSVSVERQISNTSCEEGRTWGFNRAGIWVDGGCEAVFRIDRRWR